MAISHTLVLKRPQSIGSVMQGLDSRAAVFILVALGLLVRLLPLALVGGKFLAHENPSYDLMAGQLLRHEHFSPYWPPGLPYYLAFFHALFGYGTLVARASILVIYVGFSFALYGVVKAIGSRRAANLAVLAFAFYPTYIRYAFDPSTEYLTATCLLVIVYCTVLILRKPSLGLAIFLGLSLGAVGLVRANSLALSILVPAFLLFRARRWSFALVPLVVSAVLVSAWLWKAADLAGHFVFINDANEENVVVSNHPATPLYLSCRDCPIFGPVPASFLQLQSEVDYKPSPERRRELRQATFRFILTRPDLFALRTLNRFRAYFRFPIHYADPLVRHSNTGRSLHQWLGRAVTVLDVAFFWPIMTFAIIGCFTLRSLQIDASALVTTLGVAVVYALPCWLTWSEPRYTFPVIPLFAVFCFVLLDRLLNQPWQHVLAPVLNSTSRRRAMVVTLSIFFCIQVEWIVLIVSASAWRDRWAHLTSF